jgi:glutamate--cysteine ligase
LLATLLLQRIARLEATTGMLSGCLRGIEKEGLRVNTHGQLSRKPHPAALGSALTHPLITTDYAEALIELITDTHQSVDGVLESLDQVHRIAINGMGDELLWNQSMPAALPPEADIDIAWYGTSNTGMLKHVYRRGLAVRYGKTMQCIAGLHYNFSFPLEFWDLLDLPGKDRQARQCAGYIGTIRNFVRYNWLLMYLFGASPALSTDFLRGAQTDLQPLDSKTVYLPWATSLRMSDLGYQNKAQASLKLCYNDLATFLQRLYGAVTTPWPAYEQIGTHRDGQWTQLNCNLLQIENEFYSTIRPKRTTGRGERPITALAERGVEYVEVRCLDIDPFEPCGIAPDTARFIDAFLLFCALQDSPAFEDDGYCQESAGNFATVVREGRKPGLTLQQGGIPLTLSEWASALLDDIQTCASLLTKQTGDARYDEAVHAQRAKVVDPSLVPSARVLNALKEGHVSFLDFGLSLAEKHTQHFQQVGLTATERELADRLRKESLAEQARLESDQSVSFEAYVKQFREALKAPDSAP